MHVGGGHIKIVVKYLKFNGWFGLKHCQHFIIWVSLTLHWVYLFQFLQLKGCPVFQSTSQYQQFASATTESTHYRVSFILKNWGAPTQNSWLPTLPLVKIPILLSTCHSPFACIIFCVISELPAPKSEVMNRHFEWGPRFSMNYDSLLPIYIWQHISNPCRTSFQRPIWSVKIDLIFASIMIAMSLLGSAP